MKGFSRQRESGEEECFQPECHRWDPLSGGYPGTGPPAGCRLTPPTAGPSAPRPSRRFPRRTLGWRSACPSSPCARWWAWRARKWRRARRRGSEWSCLCRSWCMSFLRTCEREREGLKWKCWKEQLTLARSHSVFKLKWLFRSSCSEWWQKSRRWNWLFSEAYCV